MKSESEREGGREMSRNGVALAQMLNISVN